MKNGKRRREKRAPLLISHFSLGEVVTCSWLVCHLRLLLRGIAVGSRSSISCSWLLKFLDFQALEDFEDGMSIVEVIVDYQYY
jgi:hypothetical protein